jgi:hypothetical protein
MWSWVPRDLDPRMTALARISSNCKRQTTLPLFYIQMFKFDNNWQEYPSQKSRQSNITLLHQHWIWLSLNWSSMQNIGLWVNWCWSSPANPLLVMDPAGPITIFFCLMTIGVVQLLSLFPTSSDIGTSHWIYLRRIQMCIIWHNICVTLSACCPYCSVD